LSPSVLRSVACALGNGSPRQANSAIPSGGTGMTPLYAKSVARSRISRRASVRVPDGQGRPGSRTVCTVQGGASISDAAITPTRTVRSRSTELLEDIAEFSNMFLECGVYHRGIPHPCALEHYLRSISRSSPLATAPAATSSSAVTANLCLPSTLGRHPRPSCLARRAAKAQNSNTLK